MKSSELLRLLHRAGWKIESQRGSHVKMVHPDRESFIIVPDHGAKEVGKGLKNRLDYEKDIRDR